MPSTKQPSLPLDRNTRVNREDLPPTTVFLDTETFGSKDHDYQRLLLGCFEAWPTNRWGLPDASGRRQLVRGVFRTVAECYSMLKHFSPCRVVAHNWQFDAAVISLGSRWARKAFGYRLDPSQGIYPCGRSGFAPFLVTLKWDDGTAIEFICNTNFHKTSLAKLGESFGLAKMDMPAITEDLLNVSIPDLLQSWVQNNDSECIQHTGAPELDRLLDIIKYCKRDVEILRLSWFELFKFSNEEAGITPGITVASMAMRMYQRRWLPIMPPGIKIKGNREQQFLADAESAAYHGGRVEVFWRGKAVGKTLQKYDANSMYPSSMLGAIPVGFAGISTEQELRVSLKRFKQGQTATTIYLAEVTVKVPEQGLGWLGWDGIHSEDAGFIFPAGTIRGWFWQPMLAVAYERGWLKEVHNVLAYHAFPIFKDFVIDVYNLRLQATRAGNKPKRLLYKYLLNSLYGKTGQGNFGEWTLLKVDDSDSKWQYRSIKRRQHCRWEDYIEGDMDKGLADYWETPEGIYRWQEPEPGMGRRSVCSIAGYITCLARATLLQAMQSLHRQGHRVYMCDTDSIVTDGRLPRDYIGEGLGKWKLEEVSDGGACEFVAPKHYTFSGDTKCKGVRKPVMGVDTYTQSQFSKWTTDFLSHNVSRNERLEYGAMVKDVTKTVTGSNNKRIVKDSPGPTYPLVVNM